MDGIQKTELVSRYAFSKNDITASTGRIKNSLFLPGNDGTTSVFRIASLDEAEIWKIGEWVGLQSNRTPKGRADISVGAVEDHGVKVAAETTTHERHAEITHWPQEKEDRLEIASLLAARANSTPIPDNFFEKPSKIVFTAQTSSETGD